MSTPARSDGAGGVEGTDLGELPDARITIDLKAVEDGWIAYDPNDREGIVGRGETGPRAAEEYCRKVAEFIDDGRQGGDR